MTRLLELYNLLYPDVVVPRHILNAPLFAEAMGQHMSVNDQVDYILLAGNADLGSPAAGVLNQLREGKITWDAQGNMIIRK